MHNYRFCPLVVVRLPYLCWNNERLSSLPSSQLTWLWQKYYCSQPSSIRLWGLLIFLVKVAMHFKCDASSVMFCLQCLFMVRWVFTDELNNEGTFSYLVLLHFTIEVFFLSCVEYCEPVKQEYRLSSCRSRIMFRISGFESRIWNFLFWKMFFLVFSITPLLPAMQIYAFIYTSQFSSQVHAINPDTLFF